MPELPEVETTRRGLVPYVRGRRVRALTVYEPRLRWPVAPRPAAPGRRATHPARRPARQVPAAATRVRHAARAPGHVGQSARRARRHPAPHRTITSTWCSIPGWRCASTIRAASAAFIYASGDPRAHPLLAHLAPEPFAAAFDADYLWRITRASACRHQATAHEQPPGGRRRQHLRERGAVPGAHPPAPAGAHTVARGCRAAGACGARGARPGHPRRRHDAARLSRRRRRARVISASGCTFTSARGRPCRRCRTPVRAITQGQRSTYYCPVLSEVAAHAVSILPTNP